MAVNSWVGLGALVVGFLTACQSSEPEREAGLFYNEMRVCIQNLTSGNVTEAIEVGNDGTLVNDSNVKQDRFDLTLGPQATACHTTSSSIQVPSINFLLDAGNGPSDVVTVKNATDAVRVVVGEDDSFEGFVLGPANKQDVDFTVGKAFTFTLDQLPNAEIVGYTNGQLRTFPNGLKAYTMDLRIVPK